MGKIVKYSKYYPEVIFLIVLLASFALPVGNEFFSIKNEGFVLMLVSIFVFGALYGDTLKHRNATSKEYANFTRAFGVGSIFLYLFLGIIFFLPGSQYAEGQFDSELLRVALIIMLASAHTFRVGDLIEKGRDYGGMYLLFTVLFIPLALTETINQSLINTGIVRLVYYALLEALVRRKV